MTDLMDIVTIILVLRGLIFIPYLVRFQGYNIQTGKTLNKNSLQYGIRYNYLVNNLNILIKLFVSDTFKKLYMKVIRKCYILLLDILNTLSIGLAKLQPFKCTPANI